ncbi:pilus assembly protein [Ensifer sp. ENS12]|uniref:pilus assembly protein n=1 Tax=Ensifer sp. ENS12 TaxID=2854774 RepID=UPI001C470FE4|nr:pilus assembly protein [Ensifer sp. ENS12]MBV7520942.1 pilus assembly protein [Ensifer sp. ENS12]
MLLRSKRALLVLAATSLVSGCADYMNHRDTITFGAGNAVEANKAIHIQDPFPRVAQNTRIAMDGKTIGKVMRNYNGTGPSAGAAMPTAVILPTATPPTGTNGYSSAAK